MTFASKLERPWLFHDVRSPITGVEWRGGPSGTSSNEPFGGVDDTAVRKKTVAGSGGEVSAPASDKFCSLVFICLQSYFSRVSAIRNHEKGFRTTLNGRLDTKLQNRGIFFRSRPFRGLLFPHRPVAAK